MLLSTLLGLAAASEAAAQDWPNRPVKAITTTSAGGLSDIFMRALGEELRQKWGQPLIIENRPGGSMNLGTRACADATPDGYTICITNADAMLYNQFLFKTLPFDPETSLQPITNAFHLIHMLVVNSQLGVKTVDELCALSKQKAGTLSYLAPGAPLVLYMETLKKEKGCDWVRVPFQRRRRGGQRDHERLDADRPVRRGQRHRQHPGRADDAARDDEQHPLAEFPEGAAADRGRLQRPAVAKLVRHLRAGRHAPARWSTGCPRTSARSSTSRSSATAISLRGASCRRPTRRSSSPRT